MDLPSFPHSAPTSVLLRKVWRECQKILKIEGPLPFTPVWNNPKYLELRDLQEFTPWKERGIWFFPQLYEGEVLKTYEKFSQEYQLTPRGFFKYLQL